MIAFDTNILVRYLVEQDDSQQVAIVDAVLEKVIASGESIFISHIVLCELVWVLTSRYRQPKEAVLAAVEGLLRSGIIEFEGSEEVVRVLKDCRSGRGDFSDYLIAERAVAAGCDRILTFDAALWSDPRFVAPGRWARA
jgi:predicted nucleic-acid-binding protein